MKKVLLGMLFIFLVFNLSAQEYGKKILYHDYGTWRLDVGEGNEIAVHAYVTRQKVIKFENEALIQKTVSNIPRYRYELMLKSKSIYEGKLTNTWLYETRVFINDIEVTKEQFPNGFTIAISTEPTLIYWYFSKITVIKFRVDWANSTYEPRTEQVNRY